MLCQESLLNIGFGGIDLSLRFAVVGQFKGAPEFQIRNP